MLAQSTAVACGQWRACGSCQQRETQSGVLWKDTCCRVEEGDRDQMGSSHAPGKTSGEGSVSTGLWQWRELGMAGGNWFGGYTLRVCRLLVCMSEVSERQRAVQKCAEI